MTQNTPFTKTKAAWSIHGCKKVYYINSTLKQEISLILRGLSDNSIPKACPIVHLIPHTPLGIALATLALMQQEDTHLSAASGGILNGPMKYKIAPSKSSNKNITPSSWASMCWTMQQSSLPSLVAIIISSLTKNPYMTLALHSISAVTTPREKHGQKGYKTTAIGRALPRLQPALMNRNTIGYTMDHISTTDNIVADNISCIPCE